MHLCLKENLEGRGAADLCAVRGERGACLVEGDLLGHGLLIIPVAEPLQLSLHDLRRRRMWACGAG